MCYASSCNPRCGKCYPPKVVDVDCPECGSLNVIRRESFLHMFDLPHKKNLIEQKMAEREDWDEPICTNCGADLHTALEKAVEPAECIRSQILCGFPCGMRNEPYNPQRRPCQHMVPLKRLKLSK